MRPEYKCTECNRVGPWRYVHLVADRRSYCCEAPVVYARPITTITRGSATVAIRTDCA